MYYELNTGAGLEPASICERRTRYVRNFYGERETSGGAHPVTAEAERRARRGRGRARYLRLLALSERIASEPMPEALREEFLALEETLHAHWLAVAIAHYNLGVEAGLHRAAIDPEALRRLPARDRLRVLLAAMTDAIGEI